MANSGLWNHTVYGYKGRSNLDWTVFVTQSRIGSMDRAAGAIAICLNANDIDPLQIDIAVPDHFLGDVFVMVFVEHVPSLNVQKAIHEFAIDPHRTPGTAWHVYYEKAVELA